MDSMDTATAKQDLYERLVQVLGTHDVHPDDRAAIQDAFEQADGWDNLPADVQQKVIDAEALPTQFWEDPADVPDDLDVRN